MRARHMRVQVRRTWPVRVTFAVGSRPRRSCLVFVVSKPRWPRCAVVPDIHLHRQRALSSAHLSESSISECVRLCDAHMAYTYGLVCNIPDRDPPRTCTYVRTYFVRIELNKHHSPPWGQSTIWRACSQDGGTCLAVPA